LTPERIDAMEVIDLAQYCPMDAAQARAKAPRLASGQVGNAAAIWAILVKHGGVLEANDITTILARAQQIQPQSAAAKRSGGLRLLEALGHVQIEREGNRLRQVRLLTELPGRPSPSETEGDASIRL